LRLSFRAQRGICSNVIVAKPATITFEQIPHLPA
jgi:hypothetical protein